MEAIILAGGKAERLGPAAEGRPKPLVRVGGRPLAAYQVAALAEGAEVRGWDPVALEEAGAIMRGVDLRSGLLDAVTGADAAVIVTEWDELRELATPEIRDAMRTPLIVDGRNLLDPDAVRAAGFTYESMGRASSDLGTLAETDESEPEPELQA